MNVLSRSALATLVSLAAGGFVVAGCGTDDTPDDNTPHDDSGSSGDVAEDATADAGDEDGDDGDDGDVVDEDAGDDDVADVDLEVLDGGTETPCGFDLTCASGEVCVVTCLCCGIDTGNPDDAATDYACVAPPAGCDGSPAECVANQEGCYANGDWLCESPCA